MTFLEIGQFLSIILAAGTPGMTYYVIGKMHKTQITHIMENCKTCRNSLDEKIGCLDGSVENLEDRQKALREKTLPDEFVRRRELEALEKKHEKEIDIIHSRIEKYHPVGTKTGD
jgi:hypothetical protein